MIKTKLCLISVMFWGVSSFGGVSMKNGNFFVGYTDLFYPGGFEPKIERVYNSKTSYRGMFGNGWGNEYEVFLTVSADGSVVVHEYGGGAENRFSPKEFSAKELLSAVDKIAEASKSTGRFGNEDQLKDYKKKLKEDSGYRNSEWEKLIEKGLVKARELPDHTKLYSNRFSYQVVSKEPKFYFRQFDSGKKEEFDLNGKLKKIKDKNNNWVDFFYSTEGKLVKILDNFNRKMFIEYNSDGKVEKIHGENGKEAFYQYDSKKETLILSKDTEGNIYKYKYDALYNMTEIEYNDAEKDKKSGKVTKEATKMSMTYYPSSEHDNIKSVKERDGTLTEYFYKIDANDKGHFTVESKLTFADAHKDRGVASKPFSTSKYEYFLKHKADGSEWTYKMTSWEGSDKTETVYNECCGLPLLIKRGGDETSFEYDTKGHVTKKITPWEITQLQYHSVHAKVARVEKCPKKSKKKCSFSSFEYDEKGNLSFAKNSEGKGVKLIYDTDGRIKSMIDDQKRHIDFKYNESSKPVEITDPALGSINVVYNNTGEIKKVESKAGRKIALQVTSAFQNLLEIIRPAGVNLSF